MSLSDLKKSIEEINQTKTDISKPPKQNFRKNCTVTFKAGKVLEALKKLHTERTIATETLGIEIKEVDTIRFCIENFLKQNKYIKD